MMIVGAKSSHQNSVLPGKGAAQVCILCKAWRLLFFLSCSAALYGARHMSSRFFQDCDPSLSCERSGGVCGSESAEAFASAFS